MLNTLRASLAVLLALTVAACSPSSRPAAPVQPAPPAMAATAGRELTVMTFNVRYGTADDGEDRWEKRRGLVMDVIRQNNPDVIGLQEALRFQIDEVRAAFPEYAEVGVGRDDGKTKGEYSAILYRTPRLTLAGEGPAFSGTFWLSDTPGVVASKTWGNGITRICSWCVLLDAASGKRFSVYNVHLDHQSEPSRRKSASLLAARLSERPADAQVPTIVTGDFNCGEGSVAIQILTGRAPLLVDDKVAAANAEKNIPCWGNSGPRLIRERLADTFRVVHPDEVNVRTFHAFKGVTDVTGKGGPRGALTEKIDYILVDGWWAVLDAAIDRTSRDGRYPSDHFPVTARVRMK